MNKKLLTAAITAGLMVPGLAAADIKMFGAIQAEYGCIDVDISGGADGNTCTSGRNTGTDSGAIHGGGANALGFKGSEKLGNGLTAYFKINQSFSTFNKSGSAAGGNSFGGRDAFVGIKGDGWHAQFGTMNSRYKAASAKYDPFLATGLQSRANGGVSNLHNGYATDVSEVGFKSGAWSGGFQVKMQDSSADTDNVVGWALNSDNSDMGSWNANIKYAANNWEAGFAYIDYDFENGAAADGDADAWKIHGKYDFGNGFAVMAQYEDVDTDSTGVGIAGGVGGGNFGSGTGGAALGNGTDWDSLHIAVTYALSDATTLIGRYATADADDIGAVAGADGDSDHWAVGVSHSLSKRTSVYGGYMANDYDRDVTADSEVDAWGIGMLHKF